MVLALNMMDEVRGNGGTVRINKMEAMLGIPVLSLIHISCCSWCSAAIWQAS